SDSIHANSSTSTGFGLGVTKRTTTTSVTGCSPSSVAINQSTTCTVLVSDPDTAPQNSPQVTVSYVSSCTNDYSGSPCTLAQVPSPSTSTFTVTYSPSPYSVHTHPTRRSSDLSDSIHANSSTSTGFGLGVTKRTTTTSVTGCSPSSVAINQSTTCTVLV